MNIFSSLFFLRDSNQCRAFLFLIRDFSIIIFFKKLSNKMNSKRKLSSDSSSDSDSDSRPSKQLHVEEQRLPEPEELPSLPEKSANSNPQDNDNQTLLEHYKTLISYKNNLFKLDTLISMETDANSLDNLMDIRQNLLQAISYEEDVIKFTQNSDEFLFSTEILKMEHIDRICKAYYEADNKWYNAKIQYIDDTDTQEAVINFIGYKDSAKLHAMFIKLTEVI
jgi:hypothetical protein